MTEIFTNEPGLCSIELFRVALSESSVKLRLKAIENVKHDVVSERLALLSQDEGADWASDPANAELVRWAAASLAKRHGEGRIWLGTPPAPTHALSA
ncbi:hypothetical protein JSE7799_01855 [Jannaschia seosinensis]|uniref:Uncharacterized protein n=1 Tax=Jannaschia seosinensis TaxID=313367 RepID=A0A0M7BBE7_9RHOB|nr:hypothetical protein [Jannaschia seosinensis]CUH39134.1 hypothetical protein JSE7799_01855 [Jannaschia seosinensis]